jgi:hypothetical protein
MRSRHLTGRCTATVAVVAFAASYLNLSRHEPGAFNEALGPTRSG